MKKKPTPNDQRSNAMNPNSEAHRSAAGNLSNQMNPNNEAYRKSRMGHAGYVEHEGGAGYEEGEASEPTKKRVVLFVGAGVSSPQVPTSNEFLKLLRQICLDDAQIKKWSGDSKLCERRHEHVVSIKYLLITLCFDRDNHTIEDLFVALDKFQDIISKGYHRLNVTNSVAEKVGPDQTKLYEFISRSYNSCIDNIYKMLHNTTPVHNEEHIQSFVDQIITRRSARHPDDVEVILAKIAPSEYAADLRCLSQTVAAVRRLIERFVYSQCLVINPYSWSGHDIPLSLNYKEFFHHLDLKNISLTIATTNYDLMLELFARINEHAYYDGFVKDHYHGFKHDRAADEQFRLLKLHGSVNWLIKDKKITTDSETLIKVQKFIRKEQSLDRDSRESFRTKFLKSLIDKQDQNLLVHYGVQKNPIHKDLFRQFQNEISNADLVIVAGYSFSDLDNGELLDCVKIAASSNKLCVIDPNPTMQNKLESLKIHTSQENVLKYYFKDFAMEDIFNKIHTMYPWFKAPF